MQVLLRRCKESMERAGGVLLRRRRDFPYVRAIRRFMTVRMDLQNTCNLRCTMCYCSLEKYRKQPLVRIDEAMLGILEREVWPRTRELWLSCSYEPFNAPNLIETLQRAKRAGVPDVRMATNATGMDHGKALELIDAPLDYLQVSLDGARQESYEAIRKGANFAHVLENVRELQKLKRERGVKKPAVLINVVMMMENIEEWGAMVRLAADLCADCISLSPKISMKELPATSSLKDNPLQVNVALADARREAQRLKIPLYAPGNFTSEGKVIHATPSHSESPWTGMIILPSGDVMPCDPMYRHLEYGNIRDGFAAVYYGEGYSRLRESFRDGRLHSACRDCWMWHGSDLNHPTTHQRLPIFSEGG